MQKHPASVFDPHIRGMITKTLRIIGRYIKVRIFFTHYFQVSSQKSSLGRVLVVAADSFKTN